MSSSSILYSVCNSVATIAFNNTEELNAITSKTATQMTAALEHAGTQARCTIVTGNGRAFCSGASLSASMNQPEQDENETDIGRMLDTHYNPLIKAMYHHPHPIITAINGAAAGIGCSIALMGDFIIASENSYFLQAFRRIGLVPDGGATFLLTRMIGRARAMEMMLFGEKIPAAKALEWGLINRIAPDGELMDITGACARKLADGPTRALAMTRMLAWQAEESDFDSQLQSERQAQRMAGQHADFREGLSAFLEKRPADFHKHQNHDKSRQRETVHQTPPKPT